jgi:hypothetical protein
MKIENITDIPTSRLREIFDFVKPNTLPTSKFTIWITYTSDKDASDLYSGIFYSGELIRLGYKTILKLLSIPPACNRVEDYDRMHIAVKVPKNENVFFHV